MLCRKSAGLSGLSGSSGHLVYLVGPVQPNKRDRPNRPDRPDRQTEQPSLAGLFGLLLVVLIMGIAGTAHAQYASSCGRSWSPSQVPGTGFLEVVPSLCVSERYDSNVFFRPPTPGLQRDDFVTNVTTVFRVNFNGRYASGVLNAGGFGEAYIKNPDLNYLGTVNSLSLNLDNTIKRWLPNASLRIVEALSYTPLPPGFANPTPGTSPDDPGNIQDVYAQGILFSGPTI